MAKPKKWNEMTPAEQAAENEARAEAKKARKIAERAALDAEIKQGAQNKGNLAKKAKKVAVKTDVKAPSGPSSAGSPVARSTAAPELPDRPLAGQGSMEGKPVEKVTVKVSPKILTKEGAAKWNAAKDAERRITQGSAPQAERRAALQAQKVITPSGAIEPTTPPAAPKPVVPSGPPKITAGDLFPEVSHARSPMVAGDIGLQTGKLSFKQRAARAAGTGVAKGAKYFASTSGKALTSTAKAITKPLWGPIADFAGGHAERKAARATADAASQAAAKGGLKARAAARAGQAAVTAKTIGATGLMGGRLALGGLKLAGEGIAAAALWDIGEKGAHASMASEATLNRLKRSGEKQGLKVTSAEPSVWRMALGGSPKIKVHDPSREINADGKSLSQKRRERGEYERIKRLASRNVIKGRSGE